MRNALRVIQEVSDEFAKTFGRQYGLFEEYRLDDAEIEDPVRAAAMARIVANNASSENGKDCVQIHGGMGYTWEVDAHLFVKRAWALAFAFGSSDDHAETMAAFV